MRFEGFSGEWEERIIGDFLKESRVPGNNGLNAKKLTVKLWGKGVIPKDDVYKGSQSTSYYLRKAGQFIYGKLDFLNQAFGIIPDKLDGYESTLDSPAFDINKNLNPTFLLEYVSRKQFYLYQGTIANGSRKAKRIHSDTFYEMPLIVPRFNEQTQIGNFFKQLDETIALHQQELDTLKQTKQGFLQKMFPKEGETVPEVRFPGFSGGGWEERQLGSIVTRVKSYSLSRDVENPDNTGFKYIHYGDIHKNVAKIVEVSSEIQSIKAGDYELLEKGDLVLADASEDYQGIAMPAIVNSDLPYNLVAGLHTIALRPKVNLLDPLFLYYLLHSEVFRKYGYRVGTGMKVFGISVTNVLGFEYVYPSIAEQTQIGSFFKQLDDTIALQQKELDALKETKKAFLQKMFI